ncbi:MAG: M50 family metallopeptidase [Chloroflexi bacterium]|nr:M50 family metallopeptidase [Chloroflexota bacterium]MCI0649000.1 M50 family metallopeptidase [Chloroflexota bacterium]MCI0729435.1 M50 family metallopeptidase [Chloroflexota bacterium]
MSAFFERLLDNPIFLLFTIISLANFVNGLRLVGVARSRWQELHSGGLQPWQKHLAERMAFFVAVPPGVLVHEFGHMLATWLFGGRVVEFGYGFYWGYIVPAGNFSAAQDWFISLAGTLGTLVYGLALWLALWRNSFAPFRYFGLRALRFHLYYGLVYYPLFTLFTFIGDWRTIYNFNATPLLSGLTLVVHVAVLGVFWYADRHGRFEMPAYQSAAEQTVATGLEQNLQQNPDDERLQLELIDSYRHSGETQKAERQLKAFLKGSPQSAEGHLQLALLQTNHKRRVPEQTARHATRALELGLAKPASQATAHYLLGRYYLDREKPDKAISAFSQGVAVLPAGSQSEEASALHYWRSYAYRRLGRYESAYQEMNQALAIAQAAGRQSMAEHCREQLAIIEKHAGRLLR